MISIPSKRFRISLITIVVPSEVETSAWMKWLSVFSVGAERAVMMTVAPPCWKRAAIALPAPFVPPVTKARLPMNSFASKELLYEEVLMSGFVISVNVDRLEFHGRQCPGSAEVCRNADLSPAFCVVCPRCLSLGCELNCVTADQKMCREMVAVSQAEDKLCHFGRGAKFVAPVRLQSLDNRTSEGSYSGSKAGVSLFARTPQFVRIPPGSKAHTFTPKGATSCASDSVNPPTAHLAAWYPALPGRARRPPIDERLESLRAQLHERCNIAVARVVHDYIETP